MGFFSKTFGRVFKRVFAGIVTGGLSELFRGDTGGRSAPSVPPAEAPPSRSDAEVQAAAIEERRRRAAARGRSSTILTSLSDESKTLLGQ